MKQKNLYVMCGPSGVGKSTFIQNNMNNFEPATAHWVSRDLIRFSLLKEGEDYFAHEDEVLNLFYKTINADLTDGFTEHIFVDATHLSHKARNTLLKNLTIPENTRRIAVAFNIPMKECLRRNSERTGRAKVPETVIRNMYKSFRIPTYEESFNFDDIIIVDMNGNETRKVR